MFHPAGNQQQLLGHLAGVAKPILPSDQVLDELVAAGIDDLDAHHAVNQESLRHDCERLRKQAARVEKLEAQLAAKDAEVKNERALRRKFELELKEARKTLVVLTAGEVQL